MERVINGRAEMVELAKELKQGEIESYSVMFEKTGAHYKVSAEKFDAGERRFYEEVDTAEQLPNPWFNAGQKKEKDDIDELDELDEEQVAENIVENTVVENAVDGDEVAVEEESAEAVVEKPAIVEAVESAEEENAAEESGIKKGVEESEANSAVAADTDSVEVPSDTQNAEQVIVPPLPKITMADYSITLADYSIEELCEEITMRGFEISLYKGASNR